MHRLKVIRLNFTHWLAEEPNMKRVDAFFSLNLVLVGVLTYTYYFACNSLDIFDRDPQLKARYERQKELNLLNKEISELASSSKTARGIASIKNSEADVVGSISHLSIDANDIARNYFAKAKEYCYQPSKEVECVTTIDTLITQFPESIWAGESLLVLTDLYRRTNRTSQIDDIVKILKTDFKQYKSVQLKVDYLEKQVL
jgi:hypothetical protein